MINDDLSAKIVNSSFNSIWIMRMNWSDLNASLEPVDEKSQSKNVFLHGEQPQFNWVTKRVFFTLFLFHADAMTAANAHNLSLYHPFIIACTNNFFFVNFQQIPHELALIMSAKIKVRGFEITELPKATLKNEMNQIVLSLMCKKWMIISHRLNEWK